MRDADRHGERGQILPLVALGFIVLIIVTTLAVDGAQLVRVETSTQSAADAAGLSAAAQWQRELSGSGYTGAPPYSLGSPDQALLVAERIAALDTVPTISADACIRAGGPANAPQLDVVYYDIAPTACPVDPPGWGSKVEVTIPPSPAIGGNCANNLCVGVAASYVQINLLAGTFGYPRSTLSSYAVAKAGTPPTLQQ